MIDPDISDQPIHSISEWERASEMAARRSQRRRQYVSPHPFPRRGEWLATFLIAVVVIAVTWLFLVFVCAGYTP